MHSSNLVVLSLRVDTPFDGHWSDGFTFWMLSPAFDQICWADCKVHFQFIRTIVPCPTKHLLLQPRFGAESSLESNRALKNKKIKTWFILKVFQVQSPLLTSQDIHFPCPRMPYHCSKLYLHITVTANYWPKYSSELHNTRIFLVLRSYCGSNIFFSFLK